MRKNSIQYYQNYCEQNLKELATFWQRLINELEIKKPDDVLPEMRQALAGTHACLKEINSTGY